MTTTTDGAATSGAPAPASGGSSSRRPRGDAQELLFPTREQYLGVVGALRAEGFETCADLCAVDYLAHPGRRLPEGVVPQRFEVVVNLLSLSQVRRVRVRVQVPADDARDPGDGTTGWNPDRPDAVHLGTPKRNPIIARSVGEPL